MKQHIDSGKEPIFIHSLFRSGSTWIFDILRRSGYWCYQEPYHEALISLNGNFELSLSWDQKTMEELRHPQLDKPYFFEFSKIQKELTGSFEKCISYDSFFDPSFCPQFDEYTKKLIDNALGRPVLQCCRSFGRVSYLRENYGGLHIYLWRNPHDQFLSSQVNDYFDTANLAIINAYNPPKIIQILRNEIGIVDNTHLSNTFEELEVLKRIPLTIKSRYLLFYTLWLYSLINNIESCDIDINIDSLTSDSVYKKQKSQAIEEHGVSADFAGCCSPQAWFSPSEQSWFCEIELRAHALFISSGYSKETLCKAIQLQKNTQPKRINTDSALARDASLARSIAFRYADSFALAQALIQQSQEEADQKIRALETELTTLAPAKRLENPNIIIIPDREMGETARRVLSLMRPMDVRGTSLVRKGRANDGGYIMSNSGLENAIAYSLGINNDVSWDLAMATLGCNVFQYDHTISALPELHPLFHWFRIGIAASPSSDGMLQPLDLLIEKNGHSDRNDLILKMDIEGAEWDAIEAMSMDTLRQFSQIVIELHNVVNKASDLLPKAERVLRKLYSTHQPVHIHANNWGSLGFIDGTLIPDTIELTYVRRTDHQFEKCYKIFPTELDMPCRPEVPDYYLGPMGCLPEVDEL